MPLVARCSACGSEVAAEGRFCAHCGAHLAASAAVTAPATRVTPSSSAAADGRFPVGIVLGERYRILGLLGRGGMGEVYRAHDLKLEQQVALKFLPEFAASSPGLMERFRGEVRIARQISHRNVCRVYDLGEVNGAAFISMEYVDGEDLASLLRRIGRLPGDKALEFARRLCAGLAAAHEKGVLHRDLKPANIMIDGRGQVLIMDFGLAAVGDAIAGPDIRSGTPAYMAPEQRDGRDVTVRSDIYALGVVLAEMFTGQRPSADGTLSTTTKDLDAAVETVIRRSVDPNPARRFASALDVARALPGGDPLAEALAAGETPSPEMVAASDDTGTLSVRASVACVAFALIGMGVLLFGTSRRNILNATPMPYPPAVLEQKARDLAARFGYTETPHDSYRLINQDAEYRSWAERTLEPATFRLQLAAGQPPALRFIYLQSPAPIVPSNPLAQPRPDDPQRIPGWLEIFLDTQGRLNFLYAVPRQETKPLTGSFDWNRLFEAAGLDPARWMPAEPREIPPAAFDDRRAWTGTYPGSPDLALRVEASAWGGRPVSFEIFGPWRPTRASIGQVTSVVRQQNARGILAVSIFLLIVFLAGVLLALRNLRTGRGDVAGAVRLGVFTSICVFMSVVLSAHYTLTGGALRKVGEAFASASGVAVFAWAAYMALEPYLRRHWPQVLIGWTRVLAGRVRDPLVGGHVLVGIAAGVGIALLAELRLALVDMHGPMQVWLVELGLALPRWFNALANASGEALALFLGFLLLRIVVRRTWIAAAIAVAVAALSGSGSFQPSPAIDATAQFLSGLIFLATSLVFLAVSIRFGILALTAALVYGQIAQTPLTADFSAWYAPVGLLHLGFYVAIAVWSFHVSLGGRQVLKGDLLDG
jgi:serine/threonine-protein kinase